MELLELRNKIKKNKPDFIRKDAHKKKRLGKKWVRPRGLHNKLRLNKRGHMKKISTGYGSPKAVKGLDRTGLEPVYVTHSIEGIDPKTQGINISGTVGIRKKIEIIKQALSKGIKILNIKNPESYAKTAEEAFKKRKEEKQNRKKKEEETKKKKAEGDKKKEGIEKAVSDEDKKDQEKTKKEEEKKEMDKVLTKKM